MGSTEKFCLRWNDFETNISRAFRELREDKDFFDVTIACDDDQIEAHKVILSACSPFFRTVLKRNKHQHPLVYLKGVRYSDMLSVLNFMYHGEVNVAQEELNSFLSVAEDLKVKGLTQNGPSTGDPPPARKPVVAQTPAAPVKKSYQQPPPPQTSYQHNQYQDDDIQEVTPVIKSEPALQTYHPVSAPLATQDTNVDTHALAATDDYVDYEGYDNSGYDDSMQIPVGDTDTTKDVEALIQSIPSEEGESWQCLVCGKICKRKYILKDHVQSLHTNSGPGHACDICYKVYKTKNSLQNHVSTYHKKC